MQNLKSKIYTILTMADEYELSNRVFCELANAYIKDVNDINSLLSFDAVVIQQIKTSASQRGIEFKNNSFTYTNYTPCNMFDVFENVEQLLNNFNQK